MGAGSSGKGGVADANLNVVPFIDLLACLICFLLISAAWTSMSRIDVAQALPKKSNDTKPLPPLLEPKINLAITAHGYLLNLQQGEVPASGPTGLAVPLAIGTVGQTRMARTGTTGSELYARYDLPALRRNLVQLMAAAGQGDNVKVMVCSSDDVPYLHLIAALDTVRTSCSDAEGKVCLKNASIGDLQLLRSAGFGAVL